MTFNNDKTAKGYNKLTDHMLHVLQLVKYYMLAKYNFNIRVTDTFRTQEEQDIIYENTPGYKENPWQSVHMFGRGVDISTHEMTDMMMDDLVRMLNNIKYSDKHNTALIHNVGRGIHLHLQVPHTRCKQPEE